MRQIKFFLFSLLFGWSVKFIPKDAIKTWTWVSKMPWEE